MSYAPPDLSVTPPYRPAPYLISGPGAFLTSEELTRYFEDFYSSLEYVNTAPQMVFDRLIGNLSVPMHAAIEKARQTSITEDSGGGIKRLEVTAPVVSPPVAPVPINVEQDVCGTKQHVIRSCTIRDNSTSSTYTKAFLTTGEVYLSRFVIALTSFRMSDTLSASACVTAPNVTGFDVALSNGHPLQPGSGFKSASCSWLELNNQDLDMQCGVWSLPVSNTWEDDIEICTTHNIPFPFRYGKAPQVLVWLKQIRLQSPVERSLRLQVSDITAVGFTLEVNSPSSCSMRGLDVSWLACSVGRPGVTIGAFDVEEEITARARCEGYVAFQKEWFKAPPRVVVGITGFTIDNKHHLSLSVRVVEVTSEGMKWRIDGGEDEKIAAARGSFIALE